MGRLQREYNLGFAFRILEKTEKIYKIVNRLEQYYPVNNKIESFKKMKS